MRRNNRKTKVSVILIILLLIIELLIGSSSFAATRQNYTGNNINNYPGYKELIDKLKTKHPNWNFTILYTGLDWNNVIQSEAAGVKNVVPIGKRGTDWARTNGQTIESGTWIQASDTAIKYYMDPRNMINEDYVFQFEDLSYKGEIQTIAGVQEIIKDITYMQGDRISYVNTNGNRVYINKTYAQVIMDAASEAGISPYHLASRIRQEQGANVSVEDRPLISGTVDGYVGYYNYLNIKATGSTTQSVIIDGLNHAKSKGWTNPQISITEGAKFIAKSYITTGQETLYLQKFDVDDQGSLFSHQYMQNISAAVSESVSVRDSYFKMGMIDASINFVIPVFENMPQVRSEMPEYGNFAKVTGNSVRLRSITDINTTIGSINSGTVVMRIARGVTNYSGNVMDKVIVNNSVGFIASQYLQDISYSTTSRGTYITNTSVNVRTAPSTNSVVIKTLLKGQIVEVNELNAWNNNGYSWSRISLADGRQVYIVTSYLSPYTYTYTPVNPVPQTPQTPTNPSVGENTKIEQNYIVCEPGVTAQKIISSNAGAVVKKADGTVVTNGKVGTGFTITMNNATYTVVKKGDVSGDGEVTPSDYVKIKNKIMGNTTMNAIAEKAADVNNDNTISPADYVKVKNHIMGNSNISI